MGETQRGITPNANGPIFFVNEYATGLRTNDPEVVDQFQELRNEFHTHKLLHTSGNPFTDIAALRAIVQPGDVVAVIGGDSTVGVAVAALAHHQLQRQGIMIAALGGGGKDDLHSSLVGNEVSMVEQFRQGNGAALYPLRIRIQQPDGTVSEQLAAHSFALGISPLLSQAANDEAYRAHPNYSNAVWRTLHEGKFVLDALCTMQPFKIATTTPSATPVVFSQYELGFYNTSPVGGLGKPPVNTTDPQAYRFRVAQASPIYLGNKIIQMAAGTLPQDPEHYLTAGERQSFTLLSDGVPGQYNGETMRGDEPLLFSVGTTFTVSIHRYCAQVLRTNPEAYPRIV